MISQMILDLPIINQSTLPFTITFMTNGGNQLNNLSLKAGTELNMTTPAKENYEFAG